MASRDVSFLTFFVMWARLQGWDVPHLHVVICVWLETCTEPERVLMVFRGAAKSTIYAVFKAWKLYRNRNHRSLIWSADGPTAEMMTADVINVLRNHPLTQGMLPAKPGKKKFWVLGARDARNASMRAVGVDSNATGARADAVDYDDVEVPGNIETPEARLHLRKRISEATHIAVPGAQKTLIGTPHAHDSIYPERIEAGAAVLKIPLFAHTVRFSKDVDRKNRFAFPHPIGPDGLYVMGGIHKGARMFVEGVDYVVKAGVVEFAKPPGMTLDICSVCAWPERFTREEVALRRRETLTYNAWDSQYMLEAKPISDERLDPDRMRPYDVEPHFRAHNGEHVMYLGKARIVSATCHWDPAGNKLKSNTSALSLMLQDEAGRPYWHRAVDLAGEVAELDDNGKVVGGQVMQVCDVVEKLSIPRVTIETNGVGTHTPSLLRGALKARRIRCGVVEQHTSANKNRKILGAFDAPLSGGYLWAHTSVLDAVEDQMRDWNPAVKEQPDDFLDAGAECLLQQPVKIGRGPKVGNPAPHERDDWRPSAGTFEVQVDEVT